MKQHNNRFWENMSKGFFLHIRPGKLQSFGLLVSLCFFLVPTSSVLGQPTLPLETKGNQVIKQQSVLLAVTDTMGGEREFGSGVNVPRFKNLTRFRPYKDPKLFNEIRKLEKEGEDAFDDLEKVIKRYVGRFGIGNFSDSTSINLLWKLGRLREIDGDTVTALFYYELAAKHRRDWLAPRIRIDTLSEPTKSEWVSLDEYYKLLDFRRRIDPLIPPKGVMQNMGSHINSAKADYAPYMHPSDSVLVFTSRRTNDNLIDPFNRPNEELFYSIQDFRTGEWSVAKKFSKAINSEFNEGSACLSPDGRTLFFTRCNDPQGQGDCDIYTATWNNGDWINITNLGEGVNSRFWDSQPHVTDDGKVMFFASNRDGGFGATDLYFTIHREDGGWSPAKNLGPVVNTPGDDVAPFYHQINGTLYFGSGTQLKNYGGFDIYKSRWMKDHWEEPKNLGPLINSRVNEYYFSIDSKGANLFYASSKRGELDVSDQDFDLYSFALPMEARPDAVTKLRGTLIDSVSGHPLVGVVMVVDLDEGVEIAPKRINERGYFEFDLKNNNRYRIYVVGENFLTIRNDLVLNGDTSFSVITNSINQNKPLVFESLEFNTNDYSFKGSAKPKLDYIVRFLKRYPYYNLIVEGHTDSDGPDDVNMDLSVQRAKRVAQYIRKQGNLGGKRITSVGFGETRPVVPNDSESNKRKNRRVEFRMVLDKSYKGETFLPTEDELKFDDEYMEDDVDEYFRKKLEREFDMDSSDDEWMEDDDLFDFDLFDEEEDADFEEWLLKDVDDDEEEDDDNSGG